MYKDAMRAAWVEINLSNLDYNIKQIKDKVGPNRKVTVVIKADAMVTELLKLPMSSERTGSIHLRSLR